MDSLSFNLATFNKGTASQAPKAGTTTPALTGLRMDPDAWLVKPQRDADDARYREPFAVKAPPKAGSGLPKLRLGWQLDETTQIKIKPSLKKFKVELTKKF